MLKTFKSWEHQIGQPSSNIVEKINKLYDRYEFEVLFLVLICKMYQICMQLYKIGKNLGFSLPISLHLSVSFPCQENL